MPIEWNEIMSVGVPEIDDQHKQLVAIVNRVDEMMMEQRDRSELGSVLNELQDYAQMHFAFEEGYFDEFKCPATDQNREEHQAFIVTFGRMLEEFQECGPTFGFVSEVYAALSTWLVNHLIRVDTKLRPFANAAKKQ